MASALIGLGAAAAVSHFALQKAKKSLAQYIAESMSEFLEVDPAQIESTLLSAKSGLVLSNIRIKPVDVTSSIRQEGVLDKIEFTWKWGGSKDGSTAFVRDAQLTVSGARIRLIVSKSNDHDDQHTSSNEQETSTDKEQNVGDTTGTYLQQILDGLTLNIMDLHVEVQVDAQDEACSGVKIEAQAIKLVSLGRDTSNHGTTIRSDTGESWEEFEGPLPPPLLQTISIKQVCAYLVDETASKDEDTAFLIEPFGYAADVKRVAGERFSGLDFGLDIAGSMIPVPGQEDMDPVVTLHAGTKQVQSLLQIFDIVSTSGSQDSGEKEASLEAPTKQIASYSTSFVLNLPSVILVLPNGSTIQTFFWCLRQRADGSVNNLQAKGAVTVNGTQAFVLLEEGECFHADFTTNRIFLQASEAEVASQVHHRAKVTWQESHMTKVLEGARQVALLANFDYNAEKQNTADAPSPPPASTQEPPWSFDAKEGVISLRIEGRKDGATQWAEASLESPSALLSDRPDELPKELSFSGATLGPTSFGAVNIRMESMQLKTDAFKRTTVDDMQTFINRALGMSSW